MAIAAVIFDMDGVLVDSEVYWHLSREEFARERGKVWTDALQRLAMGRSTVEWAHVMKEHLELSEPIDDIIKEMKGRVIAHYEDRMPDRPGALDAVRTMAGRYRVALASGSPTEIIERVMQLTGLDQVFEEIVYGDTIERGKPAPDIYLETMRRMGLSAEVCVGVEDSANGIRSLHAAKMRVIAAPSPDFPLPQEIVALSHAHITTMEDLTLDLVASLD
jgi:beta-phosphoglucomutase-like phosphatase (HAD superfamily)